ncbi:MAG: TetR/AcrR family transcriptional regulator, partial [Candidatus Zixiibacteriota bacterium]
MIARSTDLTDGLPSRQQRRYNKTRHKLLSAAREVFAEKGLAASIDEISARADVARGSFYYHFKSKERLIRDIVGDLLSELTERMNADCEGREGLESVLDGIIQAHISFFSNRWQDFVLYSQGRADLTLEESYDGLEKPFLKYAKSIEKLIDASIADPISDMRLN